mmetsp:Transcript_109153/g.233260  ORF Transcript_109153/g.233260 Transcript_109153/m.233260 type:complete len:512 (+) Transcript_109153:103-1638(+)
MGNAIVNLSVPLLRHTSETEALAPVDLPPLEAVSVPSSPCRAGVEEADFSGDLPPLEEIPAPSPSKELQGTCAVCFEEGSVLQLDCEHTYCLECLEGQLAARWPGPRVTFQYLQCALCRAPLQHDLIEDSLEKHRELRDRIVAVAARKFCEDSSPDERDENVEARAEAEMTVYMCGDCSEPYCAGRVDCAVAAAEAEVAQQHRCHECEWATLAKRDDRRCMIHGHRFAMFKCDSCCAVATWNCYSNHYCERCHNQAGQAKYYPCPGPELCPLGIPHPRNVEAIHGDTMTSFVLGCTACLGCEEAMDVNFGEQNHFGYPERNWSSFTSGEEMLASIGEQEVRDRLAAQGSAVGSAVECADQLLLLERSKQQKVARAAEAHRVALLKAAQAAQAAAEAAEALEEQRYQKRCQEGAVAAEKAAKEAAAALPAEDPIVLKVHHEASRDANARRQSTRRAHLVAKLSRIVQDKRSHQRGGRHKIPVLARADDWAFFSNMFIDDVKQLNRSQAVEAC